MKKLFSLFKRKAKVEYLEPELYDGLFSFNYNKKELEEKLQTSLYGSEVSTTLYFEGDAKLEQFKFMFIGSKTLEFYETIIKRVEPKNMLVCVEQKDMSKYSTVKNFLTLNVPESIEDLTFKNGELWYESNKIEIEKKITNFAKDTKLVIMFVENYGYYLTILQNVANHLHKLGTKTLTILFLPAKGTNLEQEFYTYSYIVLLSQMEQAFPYVLIDESKLYTEKEIINESLELKRKLHEKVANVIIDILLMAKSHSVIYHFDENNFLSTLHGAKSLCMLIGCDIYENNPYMGNMLNSKNVSSFNFEQVPVKGFVGIQPSTKGLLTKEYKKLRAFFANKDVFISIYPQRTQGAIIRGLLSFIPYPTSFLKEMEEFLSYINVTILTADGQEKERLTISKDSLETIISIQKLSISRIVTEKEDNDE